MVSDKFRFRATDTIGVADAESDGPFLEDCFIDNGLVELLSNVRDNRRIVLGRTGSGKTALLNRLKEQQHHAIEINPESPALGYISNSDILQFVIRLGVNLDIFFRLLWRHVFTVEIIKARFNLDSASATTRIIDWIRGQFSAKQKRHEKALKYLEQWGSSFWEHTDSRVTEVTTKFENDLRNSIEAAIPHLSFDISDDQKISQEERAQIVHRASFVVDSVQMQELSYVLELLNDILDDPQRPYFLVIDKLDENWVEERVRYLLIRALIETARDFFRIQNAKIILCLRYDLIDRVIHLTRNAGFQEEKYESLYLNIAWTPEQLTRLLDARINRLVRQRYTTQRVTHKDLLPRQVDKVPALEYILKRTLMRPRDIIVFFNMCIQQAGGKAMLTAEMIKTAEGEYSRSRLRSIGDEWSAEYPDIIQLASVLKGRADTIALSELTDEECLDLSIALIEAPKARHQELEAILKATEQGSTDFDGLRRYLALAFYRAGLVGLKMNAYDPIIWSTSGRRSVSIAEIGCETRLHVHPCFWRSLGIRANSHSHQ